MASTPLGLKEEEKEEKKEEEKEKEEKEKEEKERVGIWVGRKYCSIVRSLILSVIFACDIYSRFSTIISVRFLR